MKEKEERFVTKKVGGGAFSEALKIIVDKKTGVNYLWVMSGYAGGLTPLLDRDGKPIITSVANCETDG